MPKTKLGKAREKETKIRKATMKHLEDAGHLYPKSTKTGKRIKPKKTKAKSKAKSKTKK